MAPLPQALQKTIDTLGENDSESESSEIPQLYQLAQKYPPQFAEVCGQSSPPQALPQGHQRMSVVVRKARDRYLRQPAESVEQEPKQSRGYFQRLLHRQEETQSLPDLGPEVDPGSLETVVALTAHKNSLHLTAEESLQAEKRLHADLFGLGPLEPLLATENLTDIFVNGPADVWIEAKGQVSKTAVQFEGEDDVRTLATRLITAAGGRLDDAYPSADVYNDRGQRIHAVLPPLSRGGTVLSIRLQPKHRVSLSSLQEMGMFGAEIAGLLRYLVRKHKNFLISGGTGTGKTTLLGALLGECDGSERIVIIEDSAELAPQHSHVVSLQARAANAEGQGEVTLQELIRQALRMRPSRLVLGECRGAEVADMLTAMNTGHSGTGGTLHANSASAVVSRLYALGSLAGMSSQAVALQAAEAIEFVIHIEMVDGIRRIAEIARLTGGGGRLATETLCWYERCRRRGIMQWSGAGRDLLQQIQGGD